jgi:hypothetical protein
MEVEAGREYFVEMIPVFQSGGGVEGQLRVVAPERARRQITACTPARDG